MDGLLLTRRERLRNFGVKSALVMGPSVVLALAAGWLIAHPIQHGD